MRNSIVPVMLALATCRGDAAPLDQGAVAAAPPEIGFAVRQDDRIEIYRYVRDDSLKALDPSKMYGPQPYYPVPTNLWERERVVEEVSSVPAATVNATRTNGQSLSQEQLLAALSKKTLVVLVSKSRSELDPAVLHLFRDDVLILHVPQPVAPPMVRPPAIPPPGLVPPMPSVQPIPSR